MSNHIHYRLNRAIRALLGLPSATHASLSSPPLHFAPRVLLVVYDPILDHKSGMRLASSMNWQKVDELVRDYIADIRECSNGLVAYQIVDCVDRPEFIPKLGGYQYDEASYTCEPKPPHAEEWADYDKIIGDPQLNILPRIAKGAIDEVWLVGYPYAGFYESRMIGNDAFSCNAPSLIVHGCDRRFVIMGFSYERHVAQMLEAFCHRVEAILFHN